MRLLSFLFVTALFVAFTSCGGGKDKKTESEQTSTEQSNQNNQSSNDAEQNQSTEQKNERWERRKAKGDTLAMPYKELHNYLPNISGYTKDGEPQGSQMNMPGMGSWSTSEQNYTNGEKHVKVSVVDYNGAYQALQGVTGIYSMGFSAEDDNQKQQRVDLGAKGVAAYETIYKKEKKATMAIVVADRFFITINVEGDNDESFIKDVAKNMKLDKLAEM